MRCSTSGSIPYPHGFTTKVQKLQNAVDYHNFQHNFSICVSLKVRALIYVTVSDHTMYSISLLPTQYCLFIYLLV